MYKSAFLIAVLLTPSGTWVQSDGTQTTLPCPSTEHFGEKAVKMPGGCVSHAPGVWVSIERFKALKAEAAASKAEADSLRESLKKTSAARQADAAKAAGALQKCSFELQSGLDEIQRLNREKWGLGTISIGMVAGVAACSAYVWAYSGRD
tara:strand:+ start:1056 stop:1505 length:450 start_codon:yes stop_codon:yes gene_type:complete